MEGKKGRKEKESYGSRAPPVVILGELHWYHVRWTDWSLVPKRLRHFSTWSPRSPVTSVFFKGPK